MSEERVLKAMRQMAWEKAKGQMEAMLCTFYAEYDGDQYGDFVNAMVDFVSRVENNGLHE